MVAFGDIFDVSGLLADARSDIDAQGVEIAAARGGQPNLNSRIAQVNQARIDGDASNAEAISLVQARAALTEADIIDLENAQAAETLARAEAINQVNARSGLRANLIDNPSGAAGFRGWIKEGSPASYVDDDRLAGRIFVVYGYMVSQVYPAVAGDQHSLGFVASPLGDGGHVRIQYVTPGGFVEGALVTSGSAGYDVRRRSTAPSTAPAGTTGFRVVVVPPTGGVLPVWAIKVNFGSVASDFSDDYSSTVMEASVTQQSLAIVDLENQQDIAAYEVAASASSGLPAMLRLFSGLGGGYAALIAPIVALMNSVPGGDPLVALQAIGGEVFFPRPVYVDLGGRRLIMGPGNGWVLWFGPDTINASSATRTNGYFALGTDGKVYYGSAELGGGGVVPPGFAPTKSFVRGGYGENQTETTTVQPQGGAGTPSVRWRQVTSDYGTWTITSPNGATTRFGNTSSSGERRDVFEWIANDGVTTAGGFVTAFLPGV